MASPQYNPRRQHKPVEKKHKRSGASPSRGERINVPWWLWLVGGVAVGVFVSFLIKLANAPQPADSAADTQQQVAQKVPVKKPQPVAEVARPAGAAGDKSAPEDTQTVTKFDFYTLLPEREVIVPSEREAIRPTDKQKPPAEQAAAGSAERLLLQVGSFRSAQEAERRRAQIAALKLEAKVESVQAMGDTWYRVQAGPFTSREQLSAARTQLSAAGIESLILRQKP